ncbi:MAG: exo-alpha-sialidase, partial [Opitutaceae bacterium]|nr:exo-alpha-sialidase [Opitutaceae bacterium]
TSVIFFFAAAVAATWVGPGAVCAAAPLLEKVHLFEEKTDGFVSYRIPGLVVTAKGTVLVFCEARKYSGLDWGEIEIHQRRSTDGGRTFDRARQIAHLGPRLPRNPANADQPPRKVIGEPGQQTVNNPVAIADRDGTVHFIYCVEYMRVFYVRSTDDGRTWSRPVDITAAADRFRPEWAWRVIATGPCHGIQLRSGRLVVPVWLAKAEGGAHGHAVVATLFSDDHGATWQRGEIAVPNTAVTPGVSEATVAQLGDGRVMLLARNHAPSHRKVVVFSRDGATGWSRPEFAAALPEPICQASLFSYDDPAAPGKSRLLFSGPASLERADGTATPGSRRDRKNLSVKLSHDDGRTWAATRSLEPGPSAYSDLAVLPDGTILCFYESGRPGATRPNSTRTDWPYARLTLARFNLEWLVAGETAGAVRP